MDENEKLTIEKAIEILGLPYPVGRRSITIECPCCSGQHKDKRKTFNINYDKDVFNCPRCGVKGAAIQFWAIHRGFEYYDVKEAAKDYYGYIGDGAKDVLLHSQPKKTLERLDVDTADIQLRDRTFRTLLDNLSLSDTHKKNLLKRGLSEEAITHNGYKSYPVTATKTIVQKLLNNGCILQGCPGFYKGDKDEWKMLQISSGFLIPQRDGYGRIQGFQIRLDGNTSTRYITLSTGDNYKCGAKGSAYVHFTKGKKGLKEVIITEGPLKGDIISHFTGYSVIAMQGVGSQSNIESILYQLKQKGTRKVFTAFDMDMYSNEHVIEALDKLQQKIENVGLVHQQILWDEQFKGLDDWLCANYKD